MSQLLHAREELVQEMDDSIRRRRDFKILQVASCLGLGSSWVRAAARIPLGIRRQVSVDMAELATEKQLDSGNSRDLCCTMLE